MVRAALLVFSGASRMTLNAVQQTLLDPSVTEAKATPGKFKFHCNNPKTGKAQLIRDQQCYLGIGKVEVCGEDRRPLTDQQAHVVPGYQPDAAKDEVIVCQDMKRERWYRFTGTLKPFNPKSPAGRCPASSRGRAGRSAGACTESVCAQSQGQPGCETSGQ